MIRIRARLKPGQSQTLARSGSLRASAVAEAYRRRILQRVAQRGQPVDRPKQYANHGTVLVSPRYTSGGTLTKTGARAFANARALHANTQRGTYRTSGGMWRGLRKRVAGLGRARLVFGGASEGQDPRFVNGRAKGGTVSNALKAATVLAAHAVNVLKLTTDERRALVEAATHTINRSADTRFRGFIRWRQTVRPSRTAMEILRSV